MPLGDTTGPTGRGPKTRNQGIPKRDGSGIGNAFRTGYKSAKKKKVPRKPMSTTRPKTSGPSVAAAPRTSEKPKEKHGIEVKKSAWRGRWHK